MAEITPGKQTSERRGTLVGHVIALVTALLGVLVSVWGEVPWSAAIVIPISALVSSINQSSYNQSRAQVKAADSLSNGKVES